MYSGRGYREWEIGDIDIIKSGGVYHLFHLVLPNHDYIAHAISRDCINWTRVKNALFVGDPGEWDDDMLWTMNTTKTPNGFRMFYTGLSQKEHGFYQRIGIAESTDLLHWNKSSAAPFPIEPEGPHYETRIDNARQWVSFRDPYFIKRPDGSEYLILCARSPSGPISRRGCVGLLQLSEDGCEQLEPIFHPHVYDDVECPALFEMNNRFYLIGSIREDIKVRYWNSDSFRGRYASFPDNTLLPQGNYAARVTKDGDRTLLYSFFVDGHDVETATRFYCPPKELETDLHGRLILRSFSQWERKKRNSIRQREFGHYRALYGNPSASVRTEDDSVVVSTQSGYEVFAVENPYSDFSWTGRIEILRPGKLGLVFNANDSADGYYISIETYNRLAKIRAWSQRPENVHKDYLFEELQTNSFHFKESLPDSFEFTLIRYGRYIELCVNDIVVLTLIDGKFEYSRIGVYSDTAEIRLSDSVVHELHDQLEDAIGPHHDMARVEMEERYEGERSMA